MGTLVITKVGSKLKVVIDGEASNSYLNPSEVNFTYNTGVNTIDFRSHSSKLYKSITFPIANVTIGGVVITSQAVFDAQMELVFLDTNSGSGGTGTTDMDDMTQGALNKYLTASEYTTVQQIISAFTTP